LELIVSTALTIQVPSASPRNVLLIARHRSIETTESHIDGDTWALLKLVSFV
jgi:hypothetical protein